MKNIYLQFGLGHTMNVVKKSEWGLKINFKRQIMRWFEGRETQFFLLEITRDYQRLLKITRITGLPEINKITLRLRKITKDYQRLPKMTKAY